MRDASNAVRGTKWWSPIYEQENFTDQRELANWRAKCDEHETQLEAAREKEFQDELEARKGRSIIYLDERRRERQQRNKIPDGIA